jgi:hypothetical protein
MAVNSKYMEPEVIPKKLLDITKGRYVAMTMGKEGSISCNAYGEGCHSPALENEGKIVDMNDSIRKDYGIEDAYLKIVPTDGYGNPELVRHLITAEKPDAILHYTDPRFWEWLYQMEHEVRMQIPIFYYNIWDDLPYPMWNEPFYESCDLLMNISKQTVNIVKNVRQNKPVEDWQCTYVPHGINSDDFKPIDDTDAKFVQFRDELYQDNEYSFIDTHLWCSKSYTICFIHSLEHLFD